MIDLLKGDYMKAIQFLKAYARVCRMEYIPLQAPGVFVPLFIAARIATPLA